MQEFSMKGNRVATHFWPGLLGMGCVACELKVDQGDGTLWGIIHN